VELKLKGKNENKMKNCIRK